ncbi:hypothetical protein P5G65_17220 [Paenibacillus chondroitinus]|uniref:Uncharacterized protein n=1 Tax=Paenibacillus chondroitinus TaxID=59842 RepID=A0ABU6DDS0_9BACL|nr:MULTISPECIES: hypothetical protein [Paenibacillus]MCY9662134.1 hypothetical protein [Paenibacillus anseongense]MEB4795646.1 hypothetical protein [Paenibacillus chondroitinus]
MKNRVLVIKMNLLPWYNELSDELEINHPAFPIPVKTKILLFGEYSIVAINRVETRLRQISQQSDEKTSKP